MCSADSDRQVQAIANGIEDGMRKAGIKPLGIEGAAMGKWALMDYNDVVVHIFLEHVRSFYDIEGLWAEAPRTNVKDKAPAKPKAAKAPAKPKASKTAPKPRAAKPAAKKKKGA